MLPLTAVSTLLLLRVAMRGTNHPCSANAVALFSAQVCKESVFVATSDIQKVLMNPTRASTYKSVF